MPARDGRRRGQRLDDEHPGGGGDITVVAARSRATALDAGSSSSTSTTTRPRSSPSSRAAGRRTASTSRTNPNTQLRLEGHADERGSREYNIGLGERRAQAVRRVLMLQGAAGTQLTHRELR